MNDDGRVGFEYYPREEVFNAFKVTFNRGVITKVKFENYKELIEEQERTLHIKYPEVDEINHD